jgi:hypothetical protein
MSELQNRWMVQLPETTDQGEDNAFGCNCDCLCLGFLTVARGRSGVVMVVRSSGSWTAVG